MWENPSKSPDVRGVGGCVVKTREVHAGMGGLGSAVHKVWSGKDGREHGHRQKLISCAGTAGSHSNTLPECRNPGSEMDRAQPAYITSGMRTNWANNSSTCASAPNIT